MIEKILGDLAAQKQLKQISLRYFNAAGADKDGQIGERHDPEMHLIPLAIHSAFGGSELKVFGTNFPTPDGTAVRDYIHVEDLAEAHALALDHLASGGDSVRCNLGTGVGVSVNEIIAAVEDVTGQKIPVNYGPRRPGDPDSLVADPSLAKALLGWEAKRKDVREMVRPAWLWMSGPGRGRFPENKSAM
jgi:UDP-glucose 4-epimerase